MALVKGSKPERRADGSTPEVPDSIPRHGGDGRPKIAVLGDKTGLAFEYYTRASTLGKALEDTFGLDLWRRRTMLLGLGGRQDYRRKLASVIKLTDVDKRNAELDELGELALEFAAASAGATSGTALHSLSEQREAGADLSHLDADVAAALDAYGRLMAPFDVIATETFVVCDELRTAGSFDRLVASRNRLAILINGEVRGHIEPGDRIGVDLKTNKDASRFGPTYSAQQRVYFGPGSTPYTHEQGRIGWPDGVTPRQDWSLILHVPIDHPEDAGWYWVDLTEGAELARLAVTVRAQRSRKDLFYPADLAPVEPVAVAAGIAAKLQGAHEARKAEAFAGQVTAAELDEPDDDAARLLLEIEKAADDARLDELYELCADIWTDEHTAAVKAKLGMTEGLVTA